MTFKHVKFEDSAVMRSLEKLAREKGLVPSKTAATVKTASAPNLGFPQASTLMENILNLCEGLRHAGLEKQAKEIEEKYLAFKQADTIYQTSKETGDDLVDTAHPKGSHKLENVDGDEAVFETILDQHLQHLKMIEKQPTGKLAGRNDILGAVKVVLSQAVDAEQQKTAELEKLMSQVAEILRKVKAKADPELTINLNISSSLEKTNRPTLDNLETLKSNIDFYSKKLNPGGWFQYTTTLGIGGLSKDSWSIVQKWLEAANTGVDKAIKLRTEINELSGKRILENKPEPGAVPATPTVTPAATGSPVLKAMQKAINQYSGLYALVYSDSDPKFAKQKEDTLNWIKKVTDQLNTFKAEYAKLDPEAQEAQAADYTAAINKIMAPYQDVHDDWV